MNNNERWEYYILKSDNLRFFMAHLEERGRDGWRVSVATLPEGEDGKCTALLERRTTPATTASADDR